MVLWGIAWQSPCTRVSHMSSAPCHAGPSKSPVLVSLCYATLGGMRTAIGHTLQAVSVGCHVTTSVLHQWLPVSVLWCTWQPVLSQSLGVAVQAGPSKASETRSSCAQSLASSSRMARWPLMAAASMSGLLEALMHSIGFHIHCALMYSGKSSATETSTPAAAL